MTEDRWSKVRSTEEWVGKTPDAMPPPHVRLRIFRDHGGVCRWSKVKIRAGDKWAVDHVKAIIEGGENRESNMAPILHGKGSAHAAKTAREQARKAKADRMAMAAFGIRKRKSRLSHPTLKRKMSGEVVRR